MNKKTLVLFITTTIALVVLGSALILSSVIERNITKQLVQDYTEQELLIAKEVSTLLRKEVNDIREKLIVISQIPDVRDGGSEVCSQKLKSVYASMDVRPGNMGRLDEEGQFYCSVVDSLIGVDGTQYAYIQKILEDPLHEPVLSRGLLFQYIDHTRYLTALHVPVFADDGTFTGTLGGAIYLDEINEKYLREITLAERGHVILFDDNGDILYHPQQDLIGKNFWEDGIRHDVGDERFDEMLRAARRGELGNGRYSQDGKEHIASYVPFEVMDGREWTVFVAVPFEDVQAFIAKTGISDSFFQFNIFITLIIIVAGIAFLYLLQTTFGSINTFIGVAESISNGHLDTEVDKDIRDGNDEISVLANALEGMRQQIKKSRKALQEKIKALEIMDQKKDELLMITAHELKTPVASIRGFSELLKDSKNHKDKEKLHKYVNIIIQETKRLERLVNDIIDLSGIELGTVKFHYEKTTLDAILKDLKEEAQLLAKDKKLKFRYDAQKDVPAFYTDAARLQQVLTNLLSNSVKFTNKGQVSIKASKAGSRLRFIVEDTGEGIPRSELKWIFNKFYQVDSSETRRMGGTGLGLAVCKAIVEGLGGKIHVESVVGKGTTVRFTIPFLKDPPEEGSKKDSVSSS